MSAPLCPPYPCPGMGDTPLRRMEAGFPDEPEREIVLRKGYGDPIGWLVAVDHERKTLSLSCYRNQEYHLLSTVDVSAFFSRIADIQVCREGFTCLDREGETLLAVGCPVILKF